MNTWLIPREELTLEQLRAIELDTREHRVIIGGPGSGKTQILLHRGQYLSQHLGVPPDRFHILVYTNALKTYIKSALPLLNLPDDSVQTLDSCCMAFYKKRIGGPIPRNKATRYPDFEAIRSAVLAKLKIDGAKPYDFVLVDEAQDLNAEAFQILMLMADHITVCADHKQQIYDDGSEINTIFRWLGVRRSKVTLLETYRCCPYIAQLSSQLIDDTGERETYVRQSCTCQAERETPLLFYARDAEEEKQHLIDMVRRRLAMGERLAVLFPQRKQAFGFAKGFRQDAGIDVEDPAHLDFSSDKPKFMPYHSAKGLTFDTVLLPRLVGSSFKNMNHQRIMHLLFVGITRAIRWVYLSTAGEGIFEPLNRLITGEAVGCLTIQQGIHTECVTSPTTSDVKSDDDVGDLL